MLIRHATVLSMDPTIGDLPSGDVLVEDGRIAAVGPDLGDRVADEVVDATGCLVVPGFVDTHRHMWEGALRGCAPGGTLDDYFRRILLRIGPELTPDEVGLGEALSAQAALAAGITTVQDTSDIHETPARTDAVVAALQDSGLRAVFGYGVSRPLIMRQGSALPDDVRRVRSTLLPDDQALVTMALATSNGDDDAERHNAALADELGLRTVHHVRAEIRPSRLKALGALRPGTTFVHGNGLGTDELELIAEAEGSLSIAPVVETAMRLGAPMIGPVRTVPGLTAALSVDTEVTSPTDMFSQMRTAYLLGRSMGDGPSLREVLGWATTGGARALGLADRTGSVTPGKQADLLVLRADGPGVAPVVDPYSTVVLQCDRAHVDTVLVGGVAHRRDGRPVRDTTELVERARALVHRLRTVGALEAAGWDGGR